jgi:hypothetical protein
LIKKLILIAFALIVHSPAKADMSENMCQSYMAVVNQALNLRQQGVPIDIVRRPADSALKTSRELWLFLNKAINSAYKEPDRISVMLADGSLVQMCASEVRGY